MNVRNDTLVLRRRTADADEFGDGHFDRTKLIRRRIRVEEGWEQRLDVLDGALTERRVTDDNAATIVLNGPCKNLRRRRRRPVDQDSQWALPQSAGILVSTNFNVAIRIAHLHDRTAIDEETRQLDGFVERATTVVTQVHDDAVDFLGFEFFDQLLDVVRRRSEVLVSATRSEVLIKPGQFNHANLTRRLTVACRNRQNIRLRDAILQLHFVAHERDELWCRIQRAFGRNDGEADGGAFFAPD